MNEPESILAWLFNPFPSSILVKTRQDSNPKPLHRESSLLTTRPDLRPNITVLLKYRLTDVSKQISSSSFAFLGALPTKILESFHRKIKFAIHDGIRYYVTSQTSKLSKFKLLYLRFFESLEFSLSVFILFFWKCLCKLLKLSDLNWWPFLFEDKQNDISTKNSSSFHTGWKISWNIKIEFVSVIWTNLPWT